MRLKLHDTYLIFVWHTSGETTIQYSFIKEILIKKCVAWKHRFDRETMKYTKTISAFNNDLLRHYLRPWIKWYVCTTISLTWKREITLQLWVNGSNYSIVSVMYGKCRTLSDNRSYKWLRKTEIPCVTHIGFRRTYFISTNKHFINCNN